MIQGTPEPELPVVPPGEDELPFEDGVPMETDRHRQQMVLLIQTLKLAWAGRQNFFVGGNMFVYFDEEQARGRYFRGPDFFVVLDTTPRSRRSWVAWGEGGKLPNVVVELLSDSTRRVDRGEKMDVYARVWRTAEYFLYDPLSQELEGYRLNNLGVYERLEPDARGELPCEQLGLRLAVLPGVYEGEGGEWLRFLGADGEPLPTPEELVQRERRVSKAERERADAERERAEIEQKRTALLEARIRELEAKLREPR